MLLEVIRAANSHDLLIEKSRDMGASWVNLTAILWVWLFRRDKMILVGSRNDEYVDKGGNPKALFYRLDYLLDTLPVWLQPVGYSKVQHRSRNHLANPESGSVIDGESTTENFGTGDRRSIILLDEFSKVKNGHEIVASTQAVGPCRIFNGTPFGVNNAFYELTLKPDIARVRLHWTQHPIKALGLYKKVNGKYVAIDEKYWSDVDDPEAEMLRFDQMIIDRGVPLPESKERSPWYAEECKRAISAALIAQEQDIDYLGSGHQYFSSVAVNETIRKYAQPAFLVGDLDYDFQTGEPIRFREHEKGCLRLWLTLDAVGKPSIGEHKVAIGCDISAGTGASNSSACAWDDLTNEKLAEFVSPSIRPEAFAVYAVALAKWLNKAQLIWEANGPGSQFGARVVEIGYGNIYLRKNDESLTGRVSDIPGWASGKESKLVLLGAYREAIESGECVNKSKEALLETLEYIFTPDGSIEHARATNKIDPSGARANHGDRVIADALAWKGITYRKSGPRKIEPEIPVGCLAWRNKVKEKKKQLPNHELSEEWSR